MHCHGLKLSGVLEEFSITSRFFGSKMQKLLFEENKRFECSFYQIPVKVIANLPSRLKKNKHQTLDILLMTDFYEFLKTDNFLNFPKFSEIT